MATALSWYLIEQPFRRKKPTAELTEAERSQSSNSIFLGLGALGTTAIVLGLVWVVSQPPSPTPTDFSSQVAPTTEAAKDAQPPLSLLWFGDSVGWTMGGGAVRFPWPTGYDTPFDPERIVIWNKAVAECQMMQFPSRSFDILREVSGPCVNWKSDWRAAASQFSPDAIVWSGALRDTYEVLIDGEWIAFGSPQWIEIYEKQLEDAVAIASENGVPLIILSQADPKPLPEEQREDSLVAKNIGRFTQLRTIQRDFANRHQASAILIDVNELLCPAEKCAITTESGEIIRADNLHFSLAGSRYLAPSLSEQIEQSLANWRRRQTN